MSPASPQRPRILVIEDEAGIRKFIQRVLEPDYEVLLSEDGAEGLKQARWGKPHLILLDIHMPGFDGLTVLAKLKAHEETRMIPVVIVSVQGDTDVLLECQRGGAVDQIIKPFNVEDLRTVIERQLWMRPDAPEKGAGPGPKEPTSP